MEFLVKKTTRYIERDAQKRQAFAAEIEGISPEKLVFVDESGIDHICYREYARSPIGSRAYADISGKRVSRATLIAGYVREGFVAPFRFKGYTDTNVFNQWVERCLVPDLEPGQVVILDNASFHKSKKTFERIEKEGCRVLSPPLFARSQ